MGRKRKDIIGQRFGRLVAISSEGQSKKKETIWKCLCDCGNETLVKITNLTRGTTKSCGCYRRNRVVRDLSNKKFGRLLAIRIDGKKRRQNVWLCLCDCGEYKRVRTSHLTGGKVQSCGCLQKERASKANTKDLTNQRFGKLVALSKHSKGTDSYLWLCLCDCGKEKIVNINRLTSGNTRSCGDCGFFVNGTPVSIQQLKIAELLEHTEHINYSFDNSRRKIDIAIPDEKIAIEYDSWYWHADKQEKDKQRVQELIKLGWRVLSIKSKYSIPTKEIITSCINQLYTTPHIELVLDDWGSGDFKRYK